MINNPLHTLEITKPHNQGVLGSSPSGTTKHKTLIFKDLTTLEVGVFCVLSSVCGLKKRGFMPKIAEN